MRFSLFCFSLLPLSLFTALHANTAHSTAFDRLTKTGTRIFSTDLDHVVPPVNPNLSGIKVPTGSKIGTTRRGSIIHFKQTYKDGSSIIGRLHTPEDSTPFLEQVIYRGNDRTVYRLEKAVHSDGGWEPVGKGQLEFSDGRIARGKFSLEEGAGGILQRETFPEGTTPKRMVMKDAILRASDRKLIGRVDLKKHPDGWKQVK